MIRRHFVSIRLFACLLLAYLPFVYLFGVFYFRVQANTKQLDHTSNWFDARLGE
ncbi:exported hypothetical protein [Vibrio coralliirubri]|nr:exported hypothetical protein [Vibrio coralliirubri]